MKMNLFTELICNVLLYSIGFGGLMVVCAVAEGQLSLLPALAIGAVLCFTFNAVAGVRIALRNTNTQKRSVTIAPQPHPQSSTPPLRVMRGGHAAYFLSALFGSAQALYPRPECVTLILS